MRLLRLLALPLFTAGLALAAGSNYDLVVYGGTASGVMTAVSGAREGLKVVLIEPGAHIGGMATGGLSRTDYGKKEVLGGMAMEFYWRVGLKYEMGRYAQDVAWYYEPKVGERVLKEMLAEAKVDVLMKQRLREKTGVEKTGAQLTAITLDDGQRIEGKIFADCSYEGDLMAQAKVTYTFGRESSAQYGESLAGVRDHTPKHQFLVRVEPKWPDGTLLPEISKEPKGEPGQGDKKVQAYNFRMILTNDPANRVPFPAPPGYSAKRYELMARLLDAMTKKLGRSPRLQEVTLIAPIPNHKADFNNQGAFSTDYIGGSWNYPDGDYATRAKIWQAHVDYTKGYFYFLAHDPRVPKPLQAEVNQWGLPKDEFTDLNGWPHQLYIREARRMVGEYVMTQKDIQTDLTKPDPIGMGSYNSDSHNIQRVVAADGSVENEGDMQVSVQPYQMPYRMILPKRAEATNLLVPVCFSASHVAYSTLRMEPQYMIIGQAAGLAASYAIKASKAVQEIDSAALVEDLKSKGMVSEYHPVTLGPSFFHKLWEKYQPAVGAREQLPF